MEIKSRIVRIYPSKPAGSGSFPIKFTLHWDVKLGEYVLCRPRLFGYTHYTLEEAQDMVKILKEAKKECKK